MTKTQRGRRAEPRSASRRPSAARPTSCSTPGAHERRSTRCGTRPRTSWPKRSWTSFPGTKLGIGPAIDDGFYYDFELPRPLTPGRPRGDRGADGEEHRRGPSVRAPRDGARRRARLLPSSAARRSRSRSSTTSRRRRRVTGAPMPADRRSTSTGRSATCAGGRTSHRRARSDRSSCCPSPARTGGATRSGRCSSASTARSGRPRRSSTTSSGGARRRASATTAGWACSSTCSASTTSRPGAAFWHPKGWTL